MKAFKTYNEGGRGLQCSLWLTILANNCDHTQSLLCGKLKEEGRTIEKLFGAEASSTSLLSVCQVCFMSLSLYYMY